MDHDALPLPSASAAGIDDTAWQAWMALPEDARPPEDLYRWWASPEHRRELYARLRRAGPAPCRVGFAGWATRKAAAAGAPRPPLTWLVTGDEALRVLQAPEVFSNAPYRALVSSARLLNLDGPEHQQLRQQAQRWLAQTGLTAAEVAQTATRSVSDQLMPQLSANTADIDLVPVAKQLVMAYFLELFGLPVLTQPLFQQVFDTFYEGLNHLLVGRHFEDPARVDTPSKPRLGYLALAGIVAARLVEATADLPAPGAAPAPGRPLLDRLGEPLREIGDPLEVTAAIRSLSGLVLEMLAGAYGQTVSAICKGLHSATRRQRRGHGLGTLAGLDSEDPEKRRRCVLALLADDPPAPVVNRRVTRDHGAYQAGDELIVALDDLPREAEGLSGEALTEARTFGLGAHRCLGRGAAGTGGATWAEFPDLITPLIGCAIARLLDHAARHPRLTLEPLTVQWGGLCASLPIRGPGAPPGSP